MGRQMLNKGHCLKMHQFLLFCKIVVVFLLRTSPQLLVKKRLISDPLASAAPVCGHHPAHDLPPTHCASPNSGGGAELRVGGQMARGRE
jgi:hypothetical protein